MTVDDAVIIGQTRRMTHISPARIALDRTKVACSKERILSAALRVAATPGGWAHLTRDKVAREAECSDGLVSKSFGTMADFRRSIMRAAIKAEALPVIAQGLACGDKSACKANPELKARALTSLVA